MSGKIISGPAAALLIALFFFPWIMVSCQGNTLGEISGYQLATGVPPESMSGILSADDMQAEPILFAVPLTGLVVLVLLGIALWKSDFNQNAAWGQIVVTAATALVLLMAWFQMRQHSDPMIKITPLPALGSSFVALGALAAGAIIDLVLWQRRRLSALNAPAVDLPKQSFPVQLDSRAVTPAPAAETAVSQPYYHSPNASQETLVDADFSVRSHSGQETIVDEAFGDSGQATVVKTEVLSFKPEVLAMLTIEEGNNQGKKFSLLGDASIGRVADNAIVIDDTALSSYHARIQEENGRFTLQDLNSTNGIYVMSAGQTQWEKQAVYELHNGDKIKLGRTTLLFTD